MAAQRQPANWYNVRYAPATYPPGTNMRNPEIRLDILLGTTKLQYAKLVRMFLELHEALTAKLNAPNNGKRPQHRQSLANVTRMLCDAYVRYYAIAEAHGDQIASTRVAVLNPVTGVSELPQSQAIGNNFTMNAANEGPRMIPVAFPLAGTSGRINAILGANAAVAAEYGLVAGVAAAALGGGAGADGEPQVIPQALENYLQITGNIDHLFTMRGVTNGNMLQILYRKLQADMDAKRKAQAAAGGAGGGGGAVDTPIGTARAACLERGRQIIAAEDGTLGGRVAEVASGFATIGEGALQVAEATGAASAGRFASSAMKKGASVAMNYGGRAYAPVRAVAPNVLIYCWQVVKLAFVSAWRGARGGVNFVAQQLQRGTYALLRAIPEFTSQIRARFAGEAGVQAGAAGGLEAVGAAEGGAAVLEAAAAPEVAALGQAPEIAGPSAAVAEGIAQEAAGLQAAVAAGAGAAAVLDAAAGVPPPPPMPELEEGEVLPGAGGAGLGGRRVRRRKTMKRKGRKGSKKTRSRKH